MRKSHAGIPKHMVIELIKNTKKVYMFSEVVGLHFRLTKKAALNAVLVSSKEYFQVYKDFHDNYIKIGR